MRGFSALFLVLSLSTGVSRAATCVSSAEGLSSTDRLRELQILMGPNRKVGLINDTQGSYLVIEAVDGGLRATIYSTGIFDLYAIRRESPLRVCEGETQLTFEAFGRSDAMSIHGNRLILGVGEPKFRFTVGEMTPLLKKFHGGVSP